VTSQVHAVRQFILRFLSGGGTSRGTVDGKTKGHQGKGPRTITDENESVKAGAAEMKPK